MNVPAPLPFVNVAGAEKSGVEPLRNPANNIIASYRLHPSLG